MAQAEVISTTRRTFSKWLLAAGSTAIAVQPAIAPALASDPVFALISAYHRARESRVDIENALVAAEGELEGAGDLHPHVISVGNPWSGLPAPASTSHEHIDLYTPADMYPERNRAEHAALAAAIARRDGRLNPLYAALDDAEEAESVALNDAVTAEPRTAEGVRALLDLHRDWIGV